MFKISSAWYCSTALITYFYQNTDLLLPKYVYSLFQPVDGASEEEHHLCFYPGYSEWR